MFTITKDEGEQFAIMLAWMEKQGLVEIEDLGDDHAIALTKRGKLLGNFFMGWAMTEPLDELSISGGN